MIEIILFLIAMILLGLALLWRAASRGPMDTDLWPNMTEEERRLL